jgi:CHAT domain-containing protein
MKSPCSSLWAIGAICCGLLLPHHAAQAVELPALCSTAAAPLDSTTPLTELRKQVEAKSETDPNAAVAILCMAIPRVAAEYGMQSPELAWWVGALTMPMIAYLNQFAEAVPLLEFAQPILEQRYGAQSAEVADIHVAYAWIYQRQGRFAESAQAWQRALAIREKFPGEKQIELQKALVGLALVKLSQGEFAPARATLQRAHDILAANDDLVSEAAAAVENVFTNLSFREENFAEAKAHALRQLQIEKQLQAGIGQFVPGYVFLAQILEKLADFEGSEAASREAIRLAESQDSGPLQRHELTALTQLGMLLNARGRPSEALPVAQRAVAAGEKTLGPDAPRLIRAQQSLADIHHALGHLPEAYHLYERMGRTVEDHRADIELPVLIAYYRGLAALQLDLGNIDDAIAALNAGLEAARAEPTLALQRGYLMATLAQASTQRDASQSRAQYAQARELFESRLANTHPTLLRVANELCALDIKVDRALDSTNCREASLRLDGTREVDPSLRAAVYDNLSELSELQGDLEQAGTLAVAAVAAAEGIGTPEPLRKAYFRASRTLRAQGRTQLAIFFGKRAIAQIERERQYFSGADEKFDRGFLRDKIDAYRTVADWLMEAGRIDEGLEVLQLLKDQELYDFIARDAAWQPAGGGPTLDERERMLNDRYSAALPNAATAGVDIERLNRLKETGRITQAERRQLEGLLSQARNAERARARRIRQFIAQSSGTRDAARPSTDVEASSLRRAVQRAPADSAIAVYLLTEERVRLLIATPKTQQEVLIPIKAADLQRDIGRLLEAIGKRGSIEEPSRALYEQLVQPLDRLAQREKLTRLILWLDGPLRYVPFGALRDGAGFLADRYAIEMLARIEAAPASTSMATLHPPIDPMLPNVSAPSVRGFGVTQAVAGYQPLPGIADELCYVVHGPIAGLLTRSQACPQAGTGAGALAGQGFADAEFTAERFKGLLQPPHDYSVLHVGTHFSLRPGNAMRSFLVLGDGSRLMLDSLSTLDFTGLDLVTLSACQTAMGGGRTDDGREIEGLSAIVQQRGAKQVVASLWRVEDASTAQLMRAMYVALANHTDVATALQQAQRSVRSLPGRGGQPYEHPYYWAGFVISGAAE